MGFVGSVGMAEAQSGGVTAAMAFDQDQLGGDRDQLPEVLLLHDHPPLKDPFFSNFGAIIL